VTTHSNTPAGWYPDPQGAPQTLRYWDGAQWTQHTNQDQQQAQAAQPGQHMPQQQHHPWAAAGQQQVCSSRPGSPQGGPQQATRACSSRCISSRCSPRRGHAGHRAGPGGDQKAKLIELTNEYKVMDQQGNQLGSVVQVGQSALKKVLRFVSSLDQFMTHKLEIRDAYGQPQLLLTRPAKFMKSRVLVARPDGSPVGEIVQQNMIGKINFAINGRRQQVGAIKAENWRAWNFAIVDHADNEVARITKTWEGLAKTMFTTADNYVLQIHYQLPEPLLSLVVATALTVDTALKQDSRGLG
jgi:uncharacterized protein YxjI